MISKRSDMGTVQADGTSNSTIQNISIILCAVVAAIATLPTVSGVNEYLLLDGDMFTTEEGVRSSPSGDASIPKITILPVTTDSYGFNFTWTMASEADHYELFDNGDMLVNTSWISATLDGLAPGNHTFTLRTTNGSGASAHSEPVTLELGRWGELNSIGWGDLFDIDYSPDGEHIVLAGADNVIVMEADDDVHLWKRNDHGGEVGSVEWSPDGTRIASGSLDSTVRIWGPWNGTPLLVINVGGDGVLDIAWSPDGSSIVTGAVDGTVGIWDSTTGVNIGNLTGHTDEVIAVDWSHDGTRLATSGTDRTIRIWEVETGILLNVSTGHSDRVQDIEWSPDDSMIASGSDDETVQILDSMNGAVIKSFTRHSDSVLDVEWSPDGMILASGSKDGRIETWDVMNRTRMGSPMYHGGDVQGLSWHPDGRRIASVASFNTFMIWDVATRDDIANFRETTSDISSVEWSPDGKTYSYSYYRGYEVNIVDPFSGDFLDSYYGHAGSVKTIAWNPNGDRLASGGSDDIICLWDLGWGGGSKVLVGHTNVVTGISWNPDGTKVASSSSDGTVRIWDSETKELLKTLTGHRGTVTSVDWSPTGDLVVSGSNDGRVIIWDPDSGSRMESLVVSYDINSIAWSPNGSLLAVGSSDGSVTLWDRGSDDIRSTLTGHPDEVFDVAWSPDGSQIAAASGSIWIWDVWNGSLVDMIPSETMEVRTLSWSPNGTMLLMGSIDNTIRIYERSQTLPLTIPDIPDLRSETIFSNDGNHILNWKESPGAEGYEIFEDGILIKTTNTTAVQLYLPQEGVFTYIVRSRNRNGTSMFSEPIEVTIIYPIFPGGFSIVSENLIDTDGSYTIEWSSSWYAEEYEVFENGLLINRTMNNELTLEGREPGIHSYMITARNRNGTSNTRPIIIEVNRPPELDRIADITVTEDIPFSVPVIALDREGNRLWWNISSTGDWIEWKEGEQSIVGTPPEPGSRITISVVLEVTDITGEGDVESFRITTEPVNDPPRIEGIPETSMYNGTVSTIDLTTLVRDVDTSYEHLNVTCDDPRISIDGTILTIGPVISSTNETILLTVSDGEYELELPLHIVVKEPPSPGTDIDVAIGPDQVITILYSVPIDPGSLDDGDIFLRDPDIRGDPPILDVGITAGYVLFLDPISHFRSSATYELVIDEGALVDIDGVPIPGLDLEFRVIDWIPPIPLWQTSDQVLDGLQPDGIIEVVFSEEISPMDIDVDVVSYGRSARYEARVSGDRLELWPTVQPGSGESFTLRVSDIRGTEMTDTMVSPIVFNIKIMNAPSCVLDVFSVGDDTKDVSINTRCSGLTIRDGSIAYEYSQELGGDSLMLIPIASTSPSYGPIQVTAIGESGENVRYIVQVTYNGTVIAIDSNDIDLPGESMEAEEIPTYSTLSLVACLLLAFISIPRRTP